MDLQTIVNVILGGLGGLMAIILSELKNSINSLRAAQQRTEERQNKVEVLVAGNYVSKEDQRISERKMCDALQRIENKLDTVPCNNRNHIT